VIRIETGKIKVVQDGKEIQKNCMAAAIIEYKGGEVGVGSGWTIKQRRKYLKHPEKLIGRVLTVQYFEETKNQNGGYGLRFPVVKAVHGKEREI
jgi:DNA ligase-1